MKFLVLINTDFPGKMAVYIPINVSTSMVPLLSYTRHTYKTG